MPRLIIGLPNQTQFWTVLLHQTVIWIEPKPWISMVMVNIISCVKPWISENIINDRFLTIETNCKALYTFRCCFTTSSGKLFVVTVQIFVYKFLFTIVFVGKQYSRNLSHFENENAFGNKSSFWNPFWKCRHVFGKVKVPENKSSLFQSW